MTERPFIPFHRPSIDESEIAAVVSTLRSGWLTTGPRTAQFETEFKQYVGAPHALAVNSCTAALHLALRSLGVGPGDEVITTPLTFCATVNTILHVGATPVLADIGPDGNIDPEAIRARITGRTRAIVPVHYAGLPCDMDTIWTMARRRGLLVIEDAAHAVAAHYKGQPIGAGHPEPGFASDAVAFSFYATKNLSTGEGGMLTCHNAEVAARMRVLCLHGIDKDAWNRYTENGKWYYEVVDSGFKYNMSDIQASIGIEQLRKQERFLAARREIAEAYNGYFADMPELETPAGSRQARHAWHLYSLRLNLGKLAITRAEFIQRLHERRIGSSVHFIPIPLHPHYAQRLAPATRDRCPVALATYPRLVSLPLYPSLDAGQVDYIAESVKDIVVKNKRTATVAVAG